MKLILAPCDIAILTASQAWENYCNAAHLANVHRFAAEKLKYHRIAEQSLNRYFKKLYADAEKADA